jgi:N-methylhydantoinase B
VVVVDPYGAEAEVNSKGSFTVPAGGAVWFRAPGSGGYGPAGERERGRIAADVVDGYLTPASAARDYGVADASALACPACRAPR